MAATTTTTSMKTPMEVFLTSPYLSNEEISHFFRDVVEIIDVCLGKDENSVKIESDKLLGSKVFEEQKLLVLLRHSARLLREESSWISLLLFFALTHKHKKLMDEAAIPATVAVQGMCNRFAIRLKESKERFVALLEDFVDDRRRRTLLQSISALRPGSITTIPEMAANHLDSLARAEKPLDYLIFWDALLDINTSCKEKLLKDHEKDALRRKDAKGKLPAKEENENESVEAPAAATAAVDDDDDDDIIYPPSYKKPRKTEVYTVVDSDAEEN